jgi:hypothetical protein
MELSRICAIKLSVFHALANKKQSVAILRVLYGVLTQRIVYGVEHFSSTLVSRNYAMW